MSPSTTRIEGPHERIIHLDQETPALVKLLNLWPLPLHECTEIPNCFGLPFGAADFDMTAFQFQMPDMDYDEACDTGEALAGLVAAGAVRLAHTGTTGTLIPAVYLRDKTEGAFETGFAVFCDAVTEAASQALCADLLEAMPSQLATADINQLPPFIRAFERCHYSNLGDLFLETAIIDGDLVLVSPEMPAAEDLVWSALAEPGSEVRVPYLPCRPMRAELPIGQLLMAAGYGEA